MLHSCCYFIVAAAGELKQTEAVAERIGEQREAPVRMVLRRLLDRGTRGDCACDGGFDVLDNEIEMHRRPMAAVVTLPVSRGRGTRNGRLRQAGGRGGNTGEAGPGLEE